VAHGAFEVVPRAIVPKAQASTRVRLTPRDACRMRRIVSVPMFAPPFERSV